MTLVLDSAALTAIDQADRAMWVRLKGALLDEVVPVTHALAVACACGPRDRSSRLDLALDGMEVEVIDEDVARRASKFRTGLSDAGEFSDVMLVLSCIDGDEIITDDPNRLAPIAIASGRHLEVIPT